MYQGHYHLGCTYRGTPPGVPLFWVLAYEQPLHQGNPLGLLTHESASLGVINTSGITTVCHGELMPKYATTEYNH